MVTIFYNFFHIVLSINLRVYLRIKRSVMFKNSKNNMNKLSHSGTNNKHFGFRFFSQIITKGLNNRITLLSRHGREEERFP